MSAPSSSSRRDMIAQRLRWAREMAGLSQGQVAAKLGLHRPSVSEMEAGRRRVTADELSALAELYRVDFGWLAGRTDDTDAADVGRVSLAARELAKLDPVDLERVLTLLKALRK